jgi:hypothetical protein
MSKQIEEATLLSPTSSARRNINKLLSLYGQLVLCNPFQYIQQSRETPKGGIVDVGVDVSIITSSMLTT